MADENTAMIGHRAAELPAVTQTTKFNSGKSLRLQVTLKFAGGITDCLSRIRSGTRNATSRSAPLLHALTHFPPYPGKYLNRTA